MTEQCRGRVVEQFVDNGVGHRVQIRRMRGSQPVLAGRILHCSDLYLWAERTGEGLKEPSRPSRVG
ncbi:hypothetical protein GCM10009602_13670 [Nocardiopsis tropica]